MKEIRERLEQALGLKFKQGRSADWGGAYIMPIKGDDFQGMFLCDVSPLSGEKKIFLMVRIHNPVSCTEEDTDILEFDADVDDLELFINKLEWV